MVVTSMSTTLLHPCHNLVDKVVASLYKLVISAWVIALLKEKVQQLRGSREVTESSLGSGCTPNAPEKVPE